MTLSKVILESRSDDFLRTYRDKFNEADIKRIFMLSRDLATNHKYLIFLGKVLPSELSNDDIQKAKTTINRFIQYKQALKEQDINKYDSLGAILRTIYNHENKIRREYQEIEGATVVYEDDRFTVVMPQTHAASCYYGAGTKWCTATMNSATHFKSYTKEGRLFYILDKKAKSNDDNYKVAMVKKFNGDELFYNAKDDEITSGWIFRTPEWEKLNHGISEFFNAEYQKQIELWSDEERARLERERIRAREMAQQRAREQAEAEQRREDNEWNLDSGTDESNKANAIFEFLEGEGVVEEGEDIYNLIHKNWAHWNLMSFKWVGNDRYDSEYAVGTDSEADSSAKEYYVELFDDMGFEGINGGFAEGFLKEDEIRDDMERYYEDDIRENPDIYFNDDDDYEISDDQEKEIEKLESEIADYKQMIEDNEYADDEEKEGWEEKIEEFEDEIQEINDNPDKEPTEEMIDNKVKEMSDDFMYNVSTNMGDWGLEPKDYFDVEAWAEAVVESDGRGPSLSGYDGEENEVIINGVWYFIYRTN